MVGQETCGRMAGANAVADRMHSRAVVYVMLALEQKQDSDGQRLPALMPRPQRTVGGSTQGGVAAHVVEWQQTQLVRATEAEAVSDASALHVIRAAVCCGVILLLLLAAVGAARVLRHAPALDPGTRHREHGPPLWHSHRPTEAKETRE